MSYKPRTSLEINISHINKILKDLKSRKNTVQGCGLNKRFEKLKVQSPPWYEDLYPKYIQLVKDLNDY